ncbi:anti-sigma factor family protein [Streptomyces sp. NPDC049687]|uniref:anti-sigma factor family protein n=1 Tax=Streptomyces sp. NPDC049687 TaxID=3365596 RepID=UPI00378DD805
MTSTTDTTGHPDVAEISDLTEGLLTPSRSADVRRHLDSCDLCAEVHASLEEIRGLLGTLPGPPRMPDDVAHRIDAALTTEALLSATASGNEPTSKAPESPQASPVLAGDPDADAPGVSRETPTAIHRPSGHARTATTGPGRKDGKGRKRGGRRRVAVLGAVFGAAALGLGGVLVSSLTDSGGPGTSAHGQSTAADTFSQGTLEEQVGVLLDKAQGSKAPNSMGINGDTASPRPRVFQQPTVPPCVQKGIGRSDAALATEEGRYQGTDALLVLLPDASDSTKVDAYLMDRTCVGHPSAGAAKILLKNSYTRH